MNARWLRVNKKRRCPQCSRSDWCCYTDDGTVCCMRVRSETPMRNGGWLHRTGDPIPAYIPPPKPVRVERPPDLQTMWKRWESRTEFHHLDGFAMSLGVDTEALRATGCAWAETAWAFPMKNAAGEMIGIRLRDTAGRKWAVRGSHQGLFIPQVETQSTLHLVEGPTDLAAALSLGLFAIGRPSCLGQENLILEYTRNQKVRRVVIITDNDEPGRRGAAKLQSMLPVMSCVWLPPTKDIREFLNAGGDRETIDASIKDLVWSSPREARKVA